MNERELIERLASMERERDELRDRIAWLESDLAQSRAAVARVRAILCDWPIDDCGMSCTYIRAALEGTDG